MTRDPPIWVKWRAENEDEGMMATIGWQETILPSWADCEGNAEGAVHDICERHFDDEEWQRWFPEWDRAVILLEIASPPSIAGRYHVQLERVTKASARRVAP